MSPSRARHVLVWDLEVAGHHAEYIGHLARAWRRRDVDARLTVAVAPEFAERHGDLQRDVEGGRVRFAPVPAAELPHSRTSGALGRVERAVRQWRAMARAARHHGADHVLAMYLDQLLQGPMALGLRAPAVVSGIYFRPTHHYAGFGAHRPTARDRLRALRQELVLRRVLLRGDVGTVFTLDRYAADSTQGWRGGDRVVYLPDPVDAEPRDDQAVATTRERLGIEPDRRVFLLFGALTDRKGVLPVLRAAGMLPEAAAKRVAIVLAGQSPADQRAAHDRAIAAATGARPVQIVRAEGFIPHDRVQTHFHLADVVLATYQRHVGSSGILIRAAAARRPVIASDWGLMGEETRRHRLGWALDASVPARIATAMQAYVQGGPPSTFDVDQAAAYARGHRVERFTGTLLERLGVSA